jgi:hypothetical protein
LPTSDDAPEGTRPRIEDGDAVVALLAHEEKALASCTSGRHHRHSDWVRQLTWAAALSPAHDTEERPRCRIKHGYAMVSAVGHKEQRRSSRFLRQQEGYVTRDLELPDSCTLSIADDVEQSTRVEVHAGDGMVSGVGHEKCRHLPYT